MNHFAKQAIHSVTKRLVSLEQQPQHDDIMHAVEHFRHLYRDKVLNGEGEEERNFERKEFGCFKYRNRYLVDLDALSKCTGSINRMYAVMN